MKSADLFAQKIGLETSIPELKVSLLSEFPLPPKGDPEELLTHRFLCRGGGLLLVGPTGVGKSTLTLQLLILWALGRPAFGIRPARKLKSLIIQAENDQGDMAEIREGIIAGLNLSKKEGEEACRGIQVCTESSRTNFAFFDQVVRPLLEEHRIDLLIIDPALAYLGGESNSQKDVGGFLRNYLNPILVEKRIAAVVVHHTNKPPTGKEKRDWSTDELAYLGAGSAEWANWARAVVALRSTGAKDLLGSAIFDLCLGKRGSRAGWRDSETESVVYSKPIRHARKAGDICWHEVPAEEMPVKEEKGAGTKEDIYEAFEPGEKVNKTTVIKWRIAGIGEQRSRQFVKALVSEGRLLESKVPRKGAPAEVFLERPMEEPSL